MIEKKIKGSIVNVASQGGVIALKRHAAYCASKAGLISLTKVLALEWGEYGIRVNAVCPGVVQTELLDAYELDATDNPDLANYPLGRYGQPKDIALAIIYLISDASSWVTGTNLVIDGGLTIK